MAKLLMHQKFESLYVSEFGGWTLEIHMPGGLDMLTGTKIRNLKTQEFDIIVDVKVQYGPVEGTGVDVAKPRIMYITKEHGTVEAKQLFEQWQPVLLPAIPLAPVKV